MLKKLNNKFMFSDPKNIKKWNFLHWTWFYLIIRYGKAYIFMKIEKFIGVGKKSENKFKLEHQKTFKKTICKLCFFLVFPYEKSGMSMIIWKMQCY